MSKVRRSSLFRIVFFIVSATLTFVVAIIAVLVSIFGHDLYIRYKSEELMSKAEELSRQITNLYHEGADHVTVANMFYHGLYAVPEAATYVGLSNGAMITTDDPKSSEEAKDKVKFCFDTVISGTGEPVSMPRDSLGILIGVPVFDDSSGKVIGAVILLHRGSAIQEAVNGRAWQLGLMMFAILLVALIPSVLVFHFVTRPIKHVSEAAIAMANGDLDVRAVPKGSYESQYLAVSFNTLADALKHNIDHLVVERHRLGAVLDGIGEGIIALNRNGVIINFNPAVLKLLRGDDNATLASLPSYPAVAEIIRNTLDTNAKATGTVHVADRMLRITATPIHEANGAVVGAVTLISDITESERLEQTRRDYVANVSHELRTPLASIRGLSDALCDGLITDEADKQRYYGYIQREAIRLSHLIDDLLELSRLQSGGVAFSKARIDLYEIAFDVADRMNELAQRRGKTVKLTVPEGECYAHSNADRLEQVLVALTDNAIKHGNDDCCISIELGLCADVDRYVFSVSNPAEIDQADLEHVFERFYKADHAHSGEGTGLGLSIVYEVLNLLGEKINVKFADGTISFTFTVERDSKDGEHADLSNCSCELDIDETSMDTEVLQ